MDGEEVKKMPRFFNPNVFVNPNMVDGNTTNPCCQGAQNVNMTNTGCGCPTPQCPTIYKECPPIVTCSKQVVNQYHITKQPYVHTYHTEVVHHHITQNEFIPNYTCSEVHVNEPNNSVPPRL